ncbi:MAG: hypothetical protein M1574_00495 [Gammaproteobacteria bacterium]|nr:hypothetical protein [Gammaproteobacteria bacterium]
MRTPKAQLALSALATLALAFGAAPAARAVGLGSIHSRSRIGEYFSATIPILGVRPSDLRGLRVRLASRRRFAALGLVKSSVLYGLEFRVLPVPHHRHRGVIVVRSLRPLRVPFLSFVLHVRWPSGVLLRSYTVLLRPPLTIARSTPAAIVSPAAPAPAPSPSRSAPPPPTPVPSSTAVALPPLRHVYGPVRPGQSLWGIARRLRPQGVTTDRMMEALYKTNPHAFIGNINLLRAGYVLRLPSARAIAAVGRRQAVDFVLREDRLWAHAPRAVAPRRGLELLTPTVVSSRTAPAAVARLRQRLRTTQSRLAKSRAALARARKTIAALRHRLVVQNAEASRLAHKPAAKPLPSTPVPPRPTSSFPWVPVIIGFFLILLIVTLILRRRSARAEKPLTGERGRRDDFTQTPTLVGSSLAGSAEPGEVSSGPESPAAEPPPAPRPAAEPQPASAATGQRVALLAEVDFSLAYGLQGQAVDNLRSYLEQNPGDEEVHAKLVEVYANSCEAEAFLEAAEAHRASFGPDAHGTEIARWAESLGVADRLEASRAEPARDAHTSTEVETVFDELLSPPALESPGAASLDDSHLFSREATIGTATETALEFDIDLASFETPAPAPAPAAGGGTKSGEDTQSQFEESLRALRDTATGTATGTGEPMPGGATATDAVATKLSLVRAYLDMGDHDGARGLLEEVLKEGNAEQREEAQRLSQRLRD